MIKFTIDLTKSCDRCGWYSSGHVTEKELPEAFSKKDCPNCKESLRLYGHHLQKSVEVVTRCIESVHSNWSSQQCSRPRGKGKDGLYCGVHAKRYPA